MTDQSHALDALRTVRDLIRWGASRFNHAGLAFGHGTDNAVDEAFHLVLWSLHLPFDLPAVYLDAAVTAGEREAAVKLLEERIGSRKPAAYLTGEAWFAGLSFSVDERVLVPRSPIAELIAARFAPWLNAEPATILDLCAGSGCIGIACALAFDEAGVDLAEIDAGAVELIQRNIARHHLEDRARAVHGDLFAPLQGRRYDLIVSNPPYVPTREWERLAPEFRHEPRLGLDGGADGMDVVDRILRQAPSHLNAGGMLVCEIGGSQDEFEARFADLPVAWPEFEHGGDGVFVIGAEDLRGWLKPRREHISKSKG